MRSVAEGRGRRAITKGSGGKRLRAPAVLGSLLVAAAVGLVALFAGPAFAALPFGDGFEAPAAGGPVANAITLPIEVLGPAGTQRRIAVDLPDVSAVRWLYLRCHACGYRDHRLDADPALVKASVRVNGGPAIALKHYTGAAEGGGSAVGNPEIVLLGAAAAYGGIGGSFHTVDLLVPVRGLRPGRNEIEFEHRDARPPSIGFRIVRMNLLRSPSLADALLGDRDFVRDDPRAWTAPLPSAADIANGRRLWLARNILHDPFVDALDGDGPITGDIRAACADCHALDARDLKYFNFSNASIIERARFHGLSQTDGEQIASYVRSRGVAVVAEAAPWNPPYQPGAGSDARPVHAWAAGAGIDAVLASDRDMEPFLFPAGTTNAAVRAVVSRFARLNLRELPIALQLPDWNQWLPSLHPLDAFDLAAEVVRQDEKGRATARPERPFFEVLHDQLVADPAPARMEAFVLRLQDWVGRGATCFTQTLNTGPGWRATDSFVLQRVALALPQTDPSDCAGTRHDPQLGLGAELAKHGLNSWMAVKLWELHHRERLEERGAALTAPVCSGRSGTPVCVDASEARGWVMNDGMAVFNKAPHFLGHTARNFVHQDLAAGHYESSAWYHLQLILDTGYRRFAPSHFIYTMEFIENTQDSTGESQSYRYWATKIKMRQQQTNGAYGVEAGLDLRTAQPFYLWSDNRGDTSLRAGVGATRWRQIANTMLEDLVQDARNGTPAEWAAANQNRDVQDADSTDLGPCEVCFQSLARPHPFDVGPLQGRNTFRVIPRLREIGVSEATLDQLIDWSISMWPLGQWNSLRSN